MLHLAVDMGGVEMEITTRTTMHGDEDHHGQTAHVEMEITMRCEKGLYHITHI